MPTRSRPMRSLQALRSPQQVVDFWHVARRQWPEDAPHNSMRCVIAQDWAICGVVFLANSLAIGLRNTPCSLSQPALHPFAASYAVHPCELGLKERAVLIEFDSVEQATAAHDSPAYQEALAALGDGADRDIRIIEGI